MMAAMGPQQSPASGQGDDSSGGAAGGGITGPFTGRTLAGLGAQLRSGATDSVALTRAALDAIDQTQPVLNAFAAVDADGALAAARTADGELARGIDRGPLHGIPVGVKDMIDTAGLTTAMGSRHFAGRVPARDAVVVARWREAGAVLVGKTTTHQFAYGPTGDRAANGPCANPRDPRRMPGGSSAGSAAAVGAGLVPLAMGTDTGGSVRIPAALCGVAGLRPSAGRIPVTGVFPLSWSLDTVGPLAATVADAAAGWAALAGAAGEPGLPGGPGSAADPAALRVGIPAAAWFERTDPAVQAAVSGLAGRLAAAGARVAGIEIPDAEELVHVFAAVQSGEAVSIHVERMAQEPELYDPEVLGRLRAAAEVPAWDYARSLRRLGQLREEAAQRLREVDVLLLPAVPVLAPPLGARDADLGGGWTSPRDALLAYTSMWGVLGLPAISVPVWPEPGTGPRLPAGAQLVGRPGGDAALLRAARTAEALAGEPGC
jgi:aspartyl-tRNA(Asn)/glutamyl-tRNA(Gln) amidotransferase subunit A